MVQLDQHSMASGYGKRQKTERECPYIIEIAVAKDGLDVRLNREMAAFHRLHNIQSRFGRIRTQKGQRYGRWCFSEPTIAEAFRERFGGALVTNAS